MYLLVSIIHIVVCLILILVILLQAGRGGGLSEMFGGAMTQNEKLFGAETNNFMKMVTSYAAIIFVITCVLLGVLTANRSRSLIEGQRIQPVVNSDATAPIAPAMPVAPGAPVTAPAAPANSVSTTVGIAAAAVSAPVIPAEETAPAAAQ